MFPRGRGPPVFDYLIVGAGFAGSVLAERLASQAGKTVLLVERRPHVGGNAYDFYDDAGVLVHRYGPHVFHTNSERIFRYLSAFTDWRPYEHRVLAEVDGLLLPVPINRTTVNRLYGLDLRTDAECAAFFAARAEPRAHPRTAEDAVVGRVGRDLYERLFRGYTRKQWGRDPSELDASVTARIPVRTNTDDRYFTDAFQALPKGGYTALFARLLAHPAIELRLGTDWREVKDTVPHRHVVFTGPVDEFFGHSLGALPYRSLRFAFETRPVTRALPAPAVNHPNEHAYTRVAEFTQMTGQAFGPGRERTTLAYEYPQAAGEPYYPVPCPEARALAARYRALAEATPGVTFAGRLGTYQYYNMDQVVAQALTVFERLRDA
ncbi:MAG: UDP-galactopyranose mutase [Armatimonadetes bacterium]|nr:UDP-galactopyranose mutase [Armatimonadota bacterium]